MKLLNEKVAIVTGSASGIGRATAMRMAEHGAAVVIADINAVGAEETAAEIIETGGRAMSVSVDVTEPDQIEAMVEATLKRFGRLNILCNNAADLSLLQYDGDFLQTEIDVWDKTYKADLRSVMIACKHSIPPILESGGGSIVNVSSVDGALGDNTRFAYAAAKAGINVLTQCTATTYGKEGIRCNAVLPGVVLSPIAIKNLEQTPEVRRAFEDNVLTPHLGSPEELADVIVFLCSDMASYINGQLINVDGGLLSHVPQYAQIKEYFSKIQSSTGA